MFNIKRYRGKKFHKDESIHKKVEALFLLYDKRVHDNRLNYKSRIRLINIFIDDLIKFEEYEVILAFKERKFRKYKKWRRERRGKISFKLRLRLIRFKMFKLLKTLTN
jgi:hypothetical protein